MDGVAVSWLWSNPKLELWLHDVFLSFDLSNLLAAPAKILNLLSMNLSLVLTLNSQQTWTQMHHGMVGLLFSRVAPLLVWLQPHRMVWKQICLKFWRMSRLVAYWLRFFDMSSLTCVFGVNGSAQAMITFDLKENRTHTEPQPCKRAAVVLRGLGLGA